MKTFPMFLKMAGRRVIVIGGGEEAAQKTRLILKTEAEILVVADKINSELKSWVAADKITHSPSPITVTFLRSAILVFSATGCAGAAACHAALAQEANALINVVDMPDYCEALTPSIVDRDPLVVAIGTEGNAPILGRQIKSKIETALEPRLGDLVAYAGRMRDAVAQNIKQPRRRDFWNWVFNGPPRQEFRKGNERHAFSEIKKMIYTQDQIFTTSTDVVYIESNAGVSGELRIADVASLQEADLIFFEQDMHEGILEFARRDAQRFGYRAMSEVDNQLREMFARSEQQNCKSVVIRSG